MPRQHIEVIFFHPIILSTFFKFYVIDLHFASCFFIHCHSVSATGLLPTLPLPEQALSVVNFECWCWSQSKSEYPVGTLQIPRNFLLAPSPIALHVIVISLTVRTSSDPGLFDIFFVLELPSTWVGKLKSETEVASFIQEYITKYKAYKRRYEKKNRALEASFRWTNSRPKNVTLRGEAYRKNLEALLSGPLAMVRCRPADMLQASQTWTNTILEHIHINILEQRDLHSDSALSTPFCRLCSFYHDAGSLMKRLRPNVVNIVELIVKSEVTVKQWNQSMQKGTKKTSFWLDAFDWPAEAEIFGVMSNVTNQKYC